MEIIAVALVACFAIAALGAGLIYVAHSSIKERARERDDFLSELRRKMYLAAGARPDEAANAVITENYSKQLNEAIAKNVPMIDNRPETPSDPVLRDIKLPNGVKLTPI